MLIRNSAIRNSMFFVLTWYFLFSCASSPPIRNSSKIPITQKGKMSTAVLALVNRQNTIFDGNQTYVFPDGLEFYFVIYPNNSGTNPSIKQYQNFTFNGVPYWKNIQGVCDSRTVIYNAKTFAEQEPGTFVKIPLQKNTNAFIQKTVICGNTLLSKGTVSYQLYFGFGQELEEFEFTFNL